MKNNLFVVSLFLFIAMLWCSTPCIGQTYAYKHIYTIDENGVKNSPTKGIIYITFINNSSKLYLSDENGISKSYSTRLIGSGSVHLYKGEENGRYKYAVDTSTKTIPYSGGSDPYNIERLKNTFENMNQASGTKLDKKFGGIFHFSKDFNKLNIRPYITKYDEDGIYEKVVEVYERYVPESIQFYE